MKKIQKQRAVYQQISPVTRSVQDSGEIRPRVDKQILGKKFTPWFTPEVSSPTQLEGVRQKVFLDRYANKDEKGQPIEQTPEEMWTRVANGIAEMEKTPKLKRYWAEQFYKAMEGFKFVPGGRILSGAGTGYQVTFFNCYVIPSPEDSRRGIMENIMHTVEIQSRAGGVGVNLSSLRPNGARVRKVNGTSSGPVNWAALYSTANHDVIQHGGSRRGALMLMLHDWHPDLVEFIHVKEDLSKIPGANLSICVSDKFMKAVKEDGEWTTRFPDHSDPEYDELWDGDIEAWEAKGKPVMIFATYKARDLWRQICTAAWQSAEPGLHFLERSNKQSNTFYFEKLLSTNPCLTGDTWVHTNDGPKQVSDLIGTEFLARINGQNYLSGPGGFFKTGTKQVIRLQTVEGYHLRLTRNHLIKRVLPTASRQIETEWCEAGQLKIGDQILLHDHRANPYWTGEYNDKEGYLMGLLVGDGTLKTDKAVLSVWGGENVHNLAYIPGVHEVMQFALQNAFSVPHRRDFTGWMAIPGRNEHRLALGYIKHLAHQLGMFPGRKTITPEVEKTSSDFYRGFLKGLFDADGSVQGLDGRISVRLAQSDLGFLEAVQRMLLRLGIFSHIYKNRRKAGLKLLPDGKGGYKEYATRAQHELSITKDNVEVFNDLIGFANSKKATDLANKIRAHSKRGFYSERFVVRVESLETEAKTEVFDVKIPGVNYFDANGIVAHNCGEQPLGAWAVCNLGAMNLAAYVKDGQFDYTGLDADVRVAMRFMDNVVNANYYFYDINEEKAKEIRRTGIGTMGLGDALIKMQMPYGSAESLAEIEKIYKTIRDAAYETSADLATEKGPFPMFVAEKFAKGHFIRQLSPSLQAKIAKQGIRNAVILTQAPTGTTSLVSGVSSGIEPVYDFAMIRKDRIGEHVIYHPLYQKWMEENPGASQKPDYFVSANDLTPDEHVQVQALIQKYTDSSISKTVNAPNNHTIEDVEKLYMDAYDLGCKGVTYMRDGSRLGVLSHIEEKKEAEPEVAAQPVIMHRPMMLAGRTYKVETPMGEAFMTINRDDQNNPYEVFVNIAKGGMHTSADAEAIGRLISMNLRYSKGSRIDTARRIVSQLRGIGGSHSVGFGKDRVMSLADAVAKVLAEEIDLATGQGQTPEPEMMSLPLTVESPAVDEAVSAPAVEFKNGLAKHNHADLCPECGGASLVREEGCSKCYSCGYSKC